MFTEPETRKDYSKLADRPCQKTKITFDTSRSVYRPHSSTSMIREQVLLNCSSPWPIGCRSRWRKGRRLSEYKAHKQLERFTADIKRLKFRDSLSFPSFLSMHVPMSFSKIIHVLFIYYKDSPQSLFKVYYFYIRFRWCWRCFSIRMR